MSLFSHSSHSRIAAAPWFGILYLCGELERVFSIPAITHIRFNSSNEQKKCTVSSSRLIQRELQWFGRGVYQKCHHLHASRWSDCTRKIKIQNTPTELCSMGNWVSETRHGPTSSNKHNDCDARRDWCPSDRWPPRDLKHYLTRSSSWHNRNFLIIQLVNFQLYATGTFGFFDKGVSVPFRSTRYWFLRGQLRTALLIPPVDVFFLQFAWCFFGIVISTGLGNDSFRHLVLPGSHVRCWIDRHSHHYNFRHDKEI